jgi:hypothetical protein
LRKRALEYKPGSPESKEREALMQETNEHMPEFLNVVRELPRLERDPAKAARFYATLVAEVVGLDEKTRGQFEPPLLAWVTQLQRDFLSFPQRPTEPKEATAEWDRRRLVAMQEISKTLQGLVPPDKAAQTSLLGSMFIDADETSARDAFDIISGKNQ